MLALTSRWKKQSFRSVFYQTLLLLLIVGVVTFFVMNAMNSPLLAERGFSYNFLSEPSGFEMGENFLSVTPDDPNWLIFIAGLTNTIVISLIAIVLCAILGFAIALARLSHRPWLSRVALFYIETNRNLPLLLHILFWYAVCLALPTPRQAESIWPGIFATNRGVVLPKLEFGITLMVVVIGLVGVIALVFSRFNTRINANTVLTLRYTGVGLVLGGILMSITVFWPELKGLRYQNATIITPEFIALLIALAVYQSGFFAEMVRSGIVGVSRHQHEASASLGLTSTQTLRLVVMPQALRIMIPPMISQFGGLIKNSSLGVLIAYPEIVRVSMAASVDTGRIIECTLLIMASFLVVNLLLSFLLSWVNKRTAFHDA